MVKIIQISDSHLGYRTRRGVTNKWAIQNYSKPYEQEIYDLFLKVMTDISLIKNLDFVVHCGDMFHHPSKYSSYPPPEPARRAFKEGLDIFFNNTSNQIPFIYVEGNHGIFRGYEYTPFESHIQVERYSNLHYYKQRDLLTAIKNNEPLKLDFPAKKVHFYLFPYFEFKDYEVYETAYDNWIENQHPIGNDGYINIAVAHGSAGDYTLHRKINSNDFDYDYVALGHEHGLKKVSQNHYYSGSLLPMNFKEINEKQGYLIIDIDKKAKIFNIKEISTSKLLKRTFEIIPIHPSPQHTSGDLEALISKELNQFISDDGFDPKTAARLKFNFTGEVTIEKNWQINDMMSRIRRDCFSQPDKFNILQIIWKIFDLSESFEDDISPGIIQDYILEHPDEEFKTFVSEKLTEDQSHFNVDKLSQLGMRALKNALKYMEKEKEV
ncbi:MAG: metallophosphoesterase family protein [Promethearchaeota archaeon]